MNKRVWIALLILTLIGLSLRIYDLEGQSLWNDEAVSMGAAHDILDHGLDSDLVKNPGRYSSMSLLNAALLAGSISVFGDSVFALRFPAVVFGTLMIPLMFYFTRRLTKDDLMALLAAALITFLMVEVSWARSARMYQGFQFFFILSLCLLWVGHENRRPYLLIPLGISVVLTVFMHRLGLLLLPIFILYFLGTEYRRAKQNLRLFMLLLVGGGAVSLGAYAILDISVDLGSRIGITSWMVYYRDSLLLSFPIIVGLALVGICLMVKKRRRVMTLLFVSFWFPLYVLSVHYIHGSGDRFLYATIPVLVVAAAYAMVAVPRRLSKNRPWQVFAFGVIVVLILFVSDIVLIPRTGYYEFDRSLHISSMKPAYEYVNEYRTSEDVVISMWDGIGQVYLEEDPDYYLIGTGFRRGDAVYLPEYDLEEVLQTTSGWLVADMGGSYMKKIDPILATLDQVYVVSNGTPDEAWVFHW